MAQLPDWTALGGAQPSPSFRRVMPDTAGKEIEQGVESIGAAGSKLADEAQIQQTNLARAQGANALLDHELAVKQLAEQTNQDVVTGKLPYQQAAQTFNGSLAKIPTPQIANLDQVGQMSLQRGVQRNI